MHKLNLREKIFVKEYAVDLNATRAAIAAGYSERSASVTGARLITKAKVKNEIEKAMKEKMERAEINQDWVIRRYAAIAGTDKRQFFNNDGTLKPVREWTEEMAACVSSLDIQELSGEDGKSAMIKKLRLLDSRAALDSIARHLGMFVDKVEHSGSVEAPKVVIELSK